MVEQQTWVTLLGFAGFGLAMMGYLTSMKRDLKTDSASTRTDLKANNGELRKEFRAGFADLKADIGRIDSRLTTLENCTYDISTRLPPAPASTSRHTP